MEFFRSMSTRAKLLGIVSFVGSYYGYKFARDMFRFKCILTEAQEFSLVQASKPSKKFVLIDNKRSNHSLFYRYAAPIFETTSTEYAVVNPQATEFKDILGHITSSSNGEIVIAGDDDFINRCINKLHNECPSFLKTTNIGLIPLGRENSICKYLSPDQSFRAYIAQSTLVCVSGSPVSVFPLVVKSSIGETLAIDCIKTGRLAHYEELIRSSNVRSFSSLTKYYFMHKAMVQTQPEHKLTYNFVDKMEHVPSTGFNILNHPLKYSYPSIKYIIEETSYLYRISYFLLEDKNSYITDKDGCIPLHDLNCTVPAGIPVCIDGNGPIIFDSPISIQQCKESPLNFYSKLVHEVSEPEHKHSFIPSEFHKPQILSNC